jgi:hypothetical protein
MEPTGIRVQIVDREHPHFEEYGRFTGKMIRPRWANPDGSEDMAEVTLEHCRHGTDGCFVSKGHVRQVAERT